MTTFYRALTFILCVVVVGIIAKVIDLFDIAGEMTPELKDRCADLWGQVGEDGKFYGSGAEWAEFERLNSMWIESVQAGKSAGNWLCGAIVTAGAAAMTWVRSRTGEWSEIVDQYQEFVNSTGADNNKDNN